MTDTKRIFERKKKQPRRPIQAEQIASIFASLHCFEKKQAGSVIWTSFARLVQILDFHRVSGSV